MLSRRLSLMTGIMLTIGSAVVSDSHARSMYDGDWVVEVTGRTEGCQGSARYVLQIANGFISYGGGDASVTGRVSPRGVVYVRVIASSGQNAIGSGRLSRNYGSGTFNGRSSSGICAGTWVGQRVG